MLKSKLLTVSLAFWTQFTLSTNILIAICDNREIVQSETTLVSHSLSDHESVHRLGYVLVLVAQYRTSFPTSNLFRMRMVYEKCHSLTQILTTKIY